MAPVLPRTPHDADTAAALNLDLVALARSGPGPYHVKAELPLPWLASQLASDWAHTDAEITRAGAVDLEVTCMGSANILVRGQVDLHFTVPCARCLEPATVTAGGPLCVHYTRGPKVDGSPDGGRDDDDGEITEEEATSPDEHRFTGQHLDLRPMLVEQLLVAYPIRALCHHGEACRGLCMHCGADLNLQPAADTTGSATTCSECGNPGARVPVVPVPGEADPEAEADPKNDPAIAGETPWQAALRGLQATTGKKLRDR